MGSMIALLLAIGLWIVLPGATIWGWVHWVSSARSRTVFSMLSFTGLVFATLSGLLAISSILYAHVIRGFPFWDPLLLKIYGLGSLLSLAGIVFGIGGVWRSNPLRWFAPACAFGMLIFWIVAASAE